MVSSITSHPEVLLLIIINYKNININKILPFWLCFCFSVRFTILNSPRYLPLWHAIHVSAIAFILSAGTMVPHHCPAGTHTLLEQGGLQSERECLPCPPGSFCRYRQGQRMLIIATDANNAFTCCQEPHTHTHTHTQMHTQK